MAVLPDKPDLDWLRKQAKRRLHELRLTTPTAKLSEAQFALAKDYGFASWRALKAHIDSLTVDGQIIDAARNGRAGDLAALLERHPDKLHLRAQPYDMSLLHLAARDLASVDLLLKRGLDPNTRESGDNTYAMHWAAAAGLVDVVRLLADAGGDVIGHGDDHALEVIGWASCWDGCDDDAHREVVDFLVSRGARHHIFSAIALDLPDEVRRIVASDPAALNSRQSRNENHRTPLHFAVQRNNQRMVELLLALGADPLSVDGSGMTVAVYGAAPGADRKVMEKIRELTTAELVSADRGQRRSRGEPTDLVALLSLGDFDPAARLVRDNPTLVEPSGGVLHVMAKRGDEPAVRWLLEHGTHPNGQWAHWDSIVTPIHLAIMQAHAHIVRMLLDAGADPAIRDTKHDGNARDWAEFFERAEILRILEDFAQKRR